MGLPLTNVNFYVIDFMSLQNNIGLYMVCFPQIIIYT